MKLALLLILLHGPGGYEIAVNPTKITSLRIATSASEGLLHVDVRCLVSLVDGKYISVVETCADIQKMLEGAKK